MKKPDNWKHEAWLRRILDPDRFESITYMEEAVMADSTTLQAKGYQLVLITDTSVHFLLSGKDSVLNSTNSWLLTDFHAVQHLNDAATFFGDNHEVAAATRHIRCHVSDQVASPCSVLDFYSFYEDSALFHHLFQAWQQAQTRAVLPVFYPTDKNKLSKLSKLAVQSLYMHLESQLLATTKEDEEEVIAAGPDAATLSAATPKRRIPRAGEEELKGDTDGDGIDDQRIKAQAAKLRAKRKRASDHDYWDVRIRIRILEEMTLAAAAHRSFKQLSFESATLIPFLLAQLKSLSRFRAYLLGADPAQIWSYVAANEDLLLEDEVDRLRLAIACWGFLSRILSGSESIPARTKLLAWNSTTTERELRDVMDSLFLLGGIPVYGDRSLLASADSSASPGPMRAAVSLSTPTKFLEALDSHLEARNTRGRTIDEDDERYKQKYLYNLRVNRKWKEGVLGVTVDGLTKDAASATPANKSMLIQQASSLHIKDIPRIVSSQREEKAKLAARRGPARSRRDLLEKDRALDAPASAEEVGYEVVLASNESAERVSVDALRILIPELEVMFLELLFHYQQLFEHVLEVRTPHMVFNLETLFRHLLDASSDADFRQLQVPVFARGLVFMCQKERRETISYYTFVYASVLSKFMLRSSELQTILIEHQFLDLLTIDHAGTAAAAALSPQRASSAGKKTGPALALLPDIRASVLSSGSRGLHFYQRTKPLLETMLGLLAAKK